LRNASTSAFGVETMLDFTAEKQLGDFRFSAAFSLPATGVLALFGRSGAGKTTLINFLAGLARPDSGRISVHDRLLFDSKTGVDVPPEHRRIGYVFQEDRLFPHLDVTANLLYGYRRAPTADRSIRLAEIVELLGIAHLLKRRPAGLSGGEKQRVAIGRALLANPKLLLLDEPLSGLDAARKAEILPFIERLRDELRLPIVYVSHDFGEIIRLADRVVLLDHGAVAGAGPVTETLGQPELQHLMGQGEAGAIMNARIEAHDDVFSLTELHFDGGRFVTPRIAAQIGSELRLRIRARDVSIALTRPADVSILNIIPARVAKIHPAEGSDVNVELDAGVKLWARITARSAHDLSLATGLPVFALVKAVSIDRQTMAMRHDETAAPPRETSED
jgi:molybdate transport system ATP-binding protein